MVHALVPGWMFNNMHRGEGLPGQITSGSHSEGRTAGSLFPVSALSVSSQKLLTPILPASHADNLEPPSLLIIHLHPYPIY